MARKISPLETPLYVRLPNSAVDKLDRAAAALGMRKKDLVAGLVSRYVDPDSQKGLTALGSMSTPMAMSGHRKGPSTDDGGPMLGSYSFQAYEPPEIMNAQQAGQFLQIDEKMVVELAEGGKLPGKKLGPAWRFSRDALVAWLSTPDKQDRDRR